MLSNVDLRRFTMTPMRGPGARNKGIALFPRAVGGRDLALSRSDGETIGLTTASCGCPTAPATTASASPPSRSPRSWRR